MNKNMNTKSIKSLAVGDIFSFEPDGTVYRVTLPVSSGAGRTSVTYVVVGSEWTHESTVQRASLTTAHMR